MKILGVINYKIQGPMDTSLTAEWATLYKLSFTYLLFNHNECGSSVRVFYCKKHFFFTLYLHETLFTYIQHKCINTLLQL